MTSAGIYEQCGRYLQYAEEAQKHAEQATTDEDRWAWLLITQSWLNLVPLVEQGSENFSHTNESELAKQERYHDA